MLGKILCFANTFPSSAEKEGTEASAAALVAWRFPSFVCALSLGLGVIRKVNGSWRVSKDPEPSAVICF